MIDVHLLLGKLHKVEDDLENLRSVNSQTELNESMQRFGINSKDLISQAAKRQQELMDPIMRDDLVNKKKTGFALKTFFIRKLTVRRLQEQF